MQLKSDQLYNIMLHYSAMVIIIFVLIVYKRHSLLHMHGKGESHVPISDKESGVICCANHSIAIRLQRGGGGEKKKAILMLITFSLKITQTHKHDSYPFHAKYMYNN